MFARRISTVRTEGADGDLNGQVRASLADRLYVAHHPQVQVSRILIYLRHVDDHEATRG